ncbi:radical SAM protein [Methanocalculus sp.]|uniref:radical SAM protein n=1 Tax=Methanocalculus sp. TaxID=2004547 RepID=UPI0027190AFB|nr:4Fe-4S cluster-binding domain-containing protein [Methanocalculus sp.]MDO8840880.1 radical SAM protein [Methanocalculus sp.]
MLSDGCILCHQGAKLVLFVTGLCDRTCWYCPLSAERKDLDVVFANDRQARTDADIITEAEAMDALGTGVTGGEPLIVRDRTVSYCRLLKEHFGPDHHIHLYTGRAPTETDLTALQGIVDEIRMHPPHEVWDSIMQTEYPKSARLAREMGFAIGIEVPSLPGIGALRPMLPLLDFFNINELEWGETCADQMRSRGMEPTDDLHNAIEGAAEWAEEITDDPKVHFCSSGFKDSVQLRERLIRIATMTARHFDEITEDGTINYGRIRSDGDLTILLADFDEESYEIQPDGSVECAWWLLDELTTNEDLELSIIERYPNKGMIVEVNPL